MTALAAERFSPPLEKWTYKVFTLLSGTKAWKGGKAFLIIGTGKVVPATLARGQQGALPIGVFARTIDATSGDKPVNVYLGREIELERWENDTVAPLVAGTDIGKLCYFTDDQTVSLTPSGAIAGRVWDVSTLDGVLVEPLHRTPADLAKTTLAAFAAGDNVVPDYPLSGSVLELPVTAANSTVTLPANARDGTEITFTADGVLNGHTVTYRDATGPTALTTALVASKRHVVRAIFLNSKWRALAYTAP